MKCICAIRVYLCAFSVIMPNLSKKEEDLTILVHINANLIEVHMCYPCMLVCVFSVTMPNLSKKEEDLTIIVNVNPNLSEVHMCYPCIRDVTIHQTIDTLQ